MLTYVLTTVNSEMLNDIQHVVKDINVSGGGGMYRQEVQWI